MTSNRGDAALAASGPLLLTLTLQLLLLGTPPALSHPSSDAVAGVPLEYRQLQDCPGQRSLRVRITEDGAEAGKIVTLRLAESSMDFLHSSERSGSGGGVVGSKGAQFEPATLPPCFYQGSVEGEEGLAVAKQRNGWISGNFHFGSRVYEIREQPADSSLLSARRMPPSSGKRTCSLSTAEPAELARSRETWEDPSERDRKLADHHQRFRRSPMLDTYSTYNDTSRKYIQLILVGDQYYYFNQSNNMTRAQDRLWEIGNWVNALYKQIGVNVVTVYTETWQTDQYTLTSANNAAGANSSEMLDQFMLYRMRRLNFKSHTAAHLVRLSSASRIALVRHGTPDPSRSLMPHGVSPDPEFHARTEK